MKYLAKPWELLTADEMRLIHRRSVDLLARPGIYLDHDGSLDALEAKGAAVDRLYRAGVERRGLASA